MQRDSSSVRNRQNLLRRDLQSVVDEVVGRLHRDVLLVHAGVRHDVARNIVSVEARIGRPIEIAVEPAITDRLGNKIRL